MSDFMIISRSQVEHCLGDFSANIDMVKQVYMDYSQGKAVCPNSIFLRFPWGGKDRIIGLPAYIPNPERAGFKWISSFPGNVAKGMERASAVIILNDTRTGRPLACMEGALISAYRTAAFAALAAHTFGSRRERHLGICGTSFIAWQILRHLAGSGFSFSDIHLFDLNPAQMTSFEKRVSDAVPGTCHHHTSAESMIEESELVVFATDAIEPHVTDTAVFSHNPLVLHVSLRDLGNDIIRTSQNVSDNTEHAIREGTSMGNAYNAFGADSVEIHSLYDFLITDSRLKPADGRPVVFAPFGLGVLDIILAERVYQHYLNQGGGVVTIADFFGGQG